MRKYDFKKIEPKWQDYWEKIGLFRADLSRARRKYYCLMMFPYPSAALHVGHGRNYIIGDAVARYKMMKGRNVLAPMGWDAFGLPAENADIKSGIHPGDYSAKNIATMKKQMRQWGVGYDWDREINSSSPEYYRWTQWLFLKFYEKGLAYKKQAEVNWCPSCNTTLANEQVIEEKCERCRSKVEKKYLEQWFFKITDYADRLLQDLEKLGDWPQRVKSMQRNWIGRSEGAETNFRTAAGDDILIFTTRPDTLWGATFMVLAPEHPLVDKITTPEYLPRLEEYRKKVAAETEMERTSPEREKTGVFTGSCAINPVNGEKIPIWVADYVLMTYGTGAIMAVPAHDQRDFEFAEKFDLPVRVVIRPPEWDEKPLDRAYEDVDEGVMINSGPFDGTPAREAKEKVTRWLEEKKKGNFAVNYRLRDWLISRQRYWGAPIPIIYCEKCGTVPVPEKDLPVLLPRNVDFKPTGQSPLALSDEFKNTVCPTCGGEALRETDTMDTFVDSSWYFLRYLTPHDKNRPFDRELCARWFPIDQYIGGIEHATMHLIYARFFTKALHDLGLLDFSEPFRNLFTQGMICKEAYYSPGKGYLPPERVERLTGGVVDSETRSPVEVRMEKMSKSKLNVVSPDRLLEKYGADTVRLYTLFIGPPEKDAEWNDQAVEGAFRFLKRLWKKTEELAPLFQKLERAEFSPEGLSPEDKNLYRKIHQTIDKVSRDMEGDFHFNTAIASVMELLNEIYSFSRSQGVSAPEGSRHLPVLKEAVEKAVILIAPFVPHLCEELWNTLGHHDSIFRVSWPEVDPEALEVEEVEMAIQINGKLRSRMTVPVDWGEERIKQKAREDEKIKRLLKEKKVIKSVLVPRRLVNIVTRD